MKSLFLQDYGLSIKIKNTRLVFSQGIDPFCDMKGTLELPASACPFDKVVIQGKGYVSTEALERLAESNINVIMLDKRGKMYKLFSQNPTCLTDLKALRQQHVFGLKSWVNHFY